MPSVPVGQGSWSLAVQEGCRQGRIQAWKIGRNQRKAGGLGNRIIAEAVPPGPYGLHAAAVAAMSDKYYLQLSSPASIITQDSKSQEEEIGCA